MENLIFVSAATFCLILSVGPQMDRTNTRAHPGSTANQPSDHHPNLINPEQVWLDDRGQPIQAHGGGIIRVNGVYYWFGEDRSVEIDPYERDINCYLSTDLMNWKFVSRAFVLHDLYGFGKGWALERPKVFYNRTSDKYVMYSHIDDRKYDFQSIAVSESDSIGGPYRFLRTFRPFGNESGDIGQFVDQNDQQYLISSGQNGLYIYELAEDKLDVKRQVVFFPETFEAGALARYKGRYYLVASDKTLWKPNPNQYATADKLEGPWSEFKNIAPPEVNTYGSQSSMLLQINGVQTSQLLFMGDKWNSTNLYASTYNWMPLQVHGSDVALPPPTPWRIDVKTGVVSH